MLELAVEVSAAIQGETTTVPSLIEEDYIVRVLPLIEKPAPLNPPGLVTVAKPALSVREAPPRDKDILPTDSLSSTSLTIGSLIIVLPICG